MTETRAITDLGIRAFAAFLAEHTTWDSPGIVAALRAERDCDVWQLAQRMIHRAADPKNTTPRLQAFDEPLLVGCRLHPNAPLRTDGTCGPCFAETHGTDEPAAFVRRPPTDEARKLRAALSGAQGGETG